MRISAHPTGNDDCVAILVTIDAGRALRATGAAGLQLTAALP